MSLFNLTHIRIIRVKFNIIEHAQQLMKNVKFTFINILNAFPRPHDLMAIKAK